MDRVVVLFQEGGSFMYLFILLVPFVASVSLLAAMLTGSGRRVPVAAWWAGPVLLLVNGLVGTWWGLEMCLQALARASREVVPVLAANGAAVSLYTLLVGAGLAAIALSSCAVAWGLAVLIRTRGQAVPRDPLAAIPAGLTVLGTGIAWAVAGGFVAGVAGLGFLGLTLGWVASGEDRAALARDRIGLASIVAGALMSGVGAAWCWAKVMFLEAVSRASAETKPVLMAAAAEAAPSVLVVTGIAAVVLLLAVYEATRQEDGFVDRTAIAGLAAQAGALSVPLVGLALITTKYGEVVGMVGPAMGM